MYSIQFVSTLAAQLVLINLRYNKYLHSRTVVAPTWPTEFAFTFVGHAWESHMLLQYVHCH